MISLMVYIKKENFGIALRPGLFFEKLSSSQIITDGTIKSAAESIITVLIAK